MSAVIGIDPGGRQTGIILICDGKVTDAIVLEKPSGDSLNAYVAEVVGEVRMLRDRCPQAAIGVEDLTHPSSHIDGQPRVIGLNGFMGAAVVIGAVLGNWPEAVLVPPGGNGSAPLETYPTELVGDRERRGAGYRRHCRSAYDVAMYVEKTMRAGRVRVAAAETKHGPHRLPEAGFTLIEILIVLLIMGILMGLAFPLYLLARDDGDNGQAQQTLKAAMVATGDLYNATQTYGLLQNGTTTTETLTGGCEATTAPFEQLKAYDKTAVLTCTALTGYVSHAVVVKAGALAGGAAGGWVGLATEAHLTGTCWQVFISSSTPPQFGSSSTKTCSAPTPAALPQGQSWTTGSAPKSTTTTGVATQGEKTGGAGTKLPGSTKAGGSGGTHGASTGNPVTIGGTGGSTKGKTTLKTTPFGSGGTCPKGQVCGIPSGGSEMTAGTPYTSVSIAEALASIPEDRRPRVVDTPETPDGEVANLLPDIAFAQPLRKLGEDWIEVLFEDFPQTSDVQMVQNRLGLMVKPAIADPGVRSVFTEVRQRALEMRGDVAQWVEHVLEVAARMCVSDVGIGVGDCPLVKVGGVGWRRIDELPPVTPEQAEQAAFWAAKRVLNADDYHDMDVDSAVPFTTTVGTHRLRCNVYRERGNWAVKVRFIPEHPVPLGQLGLPEAVSRLADFERGLVLVTGPTGSGKSTTQAAIIDLINGRDARSIITIENPIEYVHRSRVSSVHQREVGTDTASFASALRSAMRQNPDIILVGEVRDYEEISTAITLAETGHLVFATLHTNSAAQTVSRVVDAFPPDQQNQIRTQLSMTLRAVVSQHLFQRLDQPDKGVVALELMFQTDAIAAVIRKGDVGKLPSYIMDSLGSGMIPMDRSLAELVQTGKISEAAALPHVGREESFRGYLAELKGEAW